MGLTERHLYENEDVPENSEWALEDAVYNSHANEKPEDSTELKHIYCPYRNYGCALDFNPPIYKRNEEKIIALLKEQEPRVLTLEDLDIIYNAEKTHVWPFNWPPYLWMRVNPDVRLTSGYWICWRDIMYSLENNSPFYARENYGKAWMIWTKKPTDEQRKAVKWDD